MSCQRLIVAHRLSGGRPCSGPAVTARDITAAMAIEADVRNAPDLRYLVRLCHQHAKEWDENGAL